MRVTPPGRRSTSRDTADGLEISIPAKRNIFLLVFLGVWSVGWAFGEIFALRELLVGQDAESKTFLAVWLVAWTLGGAFAVYTWLWMLTGREILLLNGDVLSVKRQPGFVRSREYDVREMKNLRLASPPLNPYDWNSAMQFWGVGGGVIAFDYGSQTVRIGAGIDEAEGRQIVAELKARHAFPETTA